LPSRRGEVKIMPDAIHTTMTPAIRGASALLLLFVLLPGQGQAHGVVSTLVRNISVIDGSGRAIQRGMDVFMEDGTITALRKTSHDADADIIVDGSGKFLVPGLIDVHAHLHFPVVFQKTEQEKQAIIDHTPSAFLYNGVTTVLNVGSEAEWIWDLRARQRAGYLTGPRIYALGHGFTPEGGWGSRHGGTSNDPGAARKKVLDYLAAGTDGLKIIIEDGLGEGSGLYREMPGDMLQAIAETAREHDIPMYLHAIGLPEYRRAVSVRPRAIVHGLEDELPADDPLLDELAGNGIAVVPTLSLFRSFLGPDPQAGENLDHPVLVGSVPAFLLENMRKPAYMREERQRFTRVARMKVYDWARERVPVLCDNVRKMHAAGVTIGVGTDAGGTVGYNYQGYNTPWEVKNLVECGLTPMEALVAATRNGAEIIGAGDRLGTIEAGKQADMLILSANPLADIENIRAVLYVIPDGTVRRRNTFAYRPAPGRKPRPPVEP